MSMVEPAFRSSYTRPTQSHTQTLSLVQKQAAYAELLRHEQADHPPARAPVARPPPQNAEVYDRSLPTNVPDHPTAIQVNGLRQSATPLAHWSGYVAGVNTYNSNVLEGNWAEERAHPDFEPDDSKLPTMLPSRALGWETTTKLGHKWHGPPPSRPPPSMAAENMYETTQMAAAKDVTDPKPRPPPFQRPGFDIEQYREDWTVGNEVMRERFKSTEAREAFKPYQNASKLTGYPKVGAARAPASYARRARARADPHARAPCAHRARRAQNRAGHAGVWH